jgi:hypothetical protein
MATQKTCETCRFAVQEETESEGYVCGNDDSIFAGDYMDGGYGCECWEGEDE